MKKLGLSIGIEKFIGMITVCMVMILPMITSAQTQSATVNGWVKMVQFVIGSLFPLLVSAAGVIFMYQVIRFVLEQSVEKRAQLRQSITTNLIILFIMLGMWGIIALVSQTFGLVAGTDIGFAAKYEGSAGGGANTLRGMVYTITNFMSKTTLPAMVAIAALSFMYNLIIYLYKSDSENERTKARDYILWSLGALIIMVSVISILNVVTQTTFGSSAFIPQFKTSDK